MIAGRVLSTNTLFPGRMKQVSFNAEGLSSGLAAPGKLVRKLLSRPVKGNDGSEEYDWRNEVLISFETSCCGGLPGTA